MCLKLFLILNSWLKCINVWICFYFTLYIISKPRSRILAEVEAYFYHLFFHTFKRPFFFLFTNIWFLFSYLQSLIHDSNLTISSMRADSLKTSTKRSAFVFEAQVAISTTFIKSRFTLRSRNDVCIFGKKGVSREIRFAKQQFCELHVTPCLRSVN